MSTGTSILNKQCNTLRHPESITKPTFNHVNIHRQYWSLPKAKKSSTVQRIFSPDYEVQSFCSYLH